MASEKNLFEKTYVKKPLALLNGPTYNYSFEKIKTTIREELILYGFVDFEVFEIRSNNGNLVVDVVDKFRPDIEEILAKIEVPEGCSIEFIDPTDPRGGAFANVSA
ncbi:hypothetical protein HZA38_01470 [Candidatus Peregrinibacteria bacterium]|nr:hypothetical protein [Candidatus Peregrinibacteria bacterium]